MFKIQYYRDGAWHLYTICPAAMVDWELAEVRANRNLGRSDTRVIPHILQAEREARAFDALIVAAMRGIDPD